MATVKEAEIRKQIDAGEVQRIYYFFGAEPFKIREQLQDLHKAFGVSVEPEIHYGDELSVQELLEACESLSLFASARFIVVRHADAIGAKDWESLLPLIHSPPENVCLVFQADQLDMRKKHATAMSKAGKDVAVVRFEPCDDREYMSWAKDLAARRKKKISAPVVQVLWNRIGPSLYELDQALEKAAIFSLRSPSIEQEHVEAVVAHTREEIVFAYTDAVASGDRTAALTALSTLYNQGEEPIAIVALLARQYRWMWEICMRLDRHERAEDINRILGLFPKLAKTLHAAVKRKGPQKIQEGLALLCASDYFLKSSAEPPRLVLDRLTLALV